MDIDELTIASRKDPMEIIIYGLDRITIGCNPITEKDTIAAYYPMRCGGAVSDVLCSYATWDKLIKGFRLIVYGTSNNSNVKNGFEKDDDIKLKLIQNGIDYILENHNIKYSPNARITDFPYIAKPSDGILPMKRVEFVELAIGICLYTVGISAMR